MPHTTSTTGHWITTRFSGLISADDLRRSVEEIEAIEATAAVTPFRLTDLSASDMVHLSFQSIGELAARRRSAVLKNPVRSAIVAPSLVQYGFSRMFQILNDNPRIDVEVFREMDAAVAWLGSDPNDMVQRLVSRFRQT